MIPLIVLAVLLAGQALMHEREKQQWAKERTFLTNAAVSRSQTEFAIRQAAATRPAPAPRPAPPVVASLDDLPEELHQAPVTNMPLGL